MLIHKPGGQFITTAGEDQSVHVWDSTTGTELARMIHNGPVSSVDFHKNGKELAAGGDNGALIVWDVSTRTLDEYRVPHLASRHFHCL